MLSFQMIFNPWGVVKAEQARRVAAEKSAIDAYATLNGVMKHRDVLQHRLDAEYARRSAATAKGNRTRAANARALQAPVTADLRAGAGL